MSRTIDYRIRISSDTSGARAAATALDDISRQSAGLTQGFSSVQQAASGNAMALVNVVRSLRAVTSATTALQAALPLIGILIGVASAAWNAYRDRQNESASAMKEANDKLIASQERLQKVISAARAPSYEPQVRALRDLADAFSRTEKAANDFKAAQDRAAGISTATNIAEINRAAARQKQMFAGDEEQQANIDLNARRTAAAESFQADYAAIERDAAAQSATIERLNKTIFSLRMQGNAEEWSGNTPLKQAEARLAALSAQRGKEMLAGNESAETNELFVEAFRVREQMKKEFQAFEDQRKKQLAEAEAALVSAEQASALNAARKKQLAADYAAQEAADFAAESARVAARDRKLAQERETQRQQDLRADAEAQKKAVRQSAEKRADEISEALPQAQKQAADAAAAEQKLRARLVSPAARRQQDESERDARREEKSLESRIRRAESAQARGVKGKWINEALSFRDARAEAESKKQELSQLEIDRTAAAKQSRDSLANIEEYLAAALQMGGGQGA